MRSRAESFISRIVAAARPARPWLHINASPRVALFLVAAGARPARIDLHNADLSMKSLARADLRVADLRVARLAEYAGDQSDADLDAMLAAAGDRLLTAVQASLDLDAGLAEQRSSVILPGPGCPAGMTSPRRGRSRGTPDQDGTASREYPGGQRGRPLPGRGPANRFTGTSPLCVPRRPLQRPRRPGWPRTVQSARMRSGKDPPPL